MVWQEAKKKNSCSDKKTAEASGLEASAVRVSKQWGRAGGGGATSVGRGCF